ncbi:hypothetical protein RFI_33131, partial [Reticulomyxa filosa]
TCLDQDLKCHLITNMKLHFDLAHKVFLDMKSQSILLNKTILSMQQEIQLKKKCSIAENNLIKEELQKCQASIETIKKEFNDQKKQNQEKNIESTRNLESIDVLTSPVKQIDRGNMISFNLIRQSESFKQSKTERIYSIDYKTFNDCQFLCSGSEDGKCTIYAIKQKSERCIKKYSKPVYSVKFSPYQDIICYSSHDNAIRFWDFKKNEIVSVFKEHSKSVFCIEFLQFNNRQYLCSGSDDKTIRLWDVTEKNTKHVFNGHEGGVLCLDVSAVQGTIGGNGYTICSGSCDNTICIWDIETKKQSSVFKEHNRRVLSVKYGSNKLGNIGCANTILSGSSDKTVRLWDIRSNENATVFNKHISCVYAVEYSPFIVPDNNLAVNANVICSGSEDNTIRFWDIRLNNKELFVIDGDKGDKGIYCLKFVSSKTKSDDNNNVCLYYGSNTGLWKKTLI